MKSGFSLLILFLGIVFIIAGALILFKFQGDDFLSLYLIFILGCAIILNIFIHSLKREFDIFEPVLCFSFFYFYFLVLRPLYIILTGDNLFFNYFSVDKDYMLSAALYAVVGYFCFAVGYLVRSRGVLSFYNTVIPRIKSSDEINTKKLLFFCLVLSGTAIATYVNFYIINNPQINSEVETLRGSTAYIYEGLWLLVPVTVMFFAFRKKYLYFKLAFVISFTTSLYIYLGLHHRSRWFVLLVTLFVIYYLQNYRRPNIFILVPVGLFLVTASVVTGVIRGIVRGILSGDITLNTILNFKEQLLLGSVTSLGGNTMFDTFVLYIQKIPEKLNFLFGLGLLQILVQPIPSVLWKAKPLLQNTYFMKMVLPESYEGGQNLPPTILGDFYMNFGSVGIVICMFLLGVFVRGTYLWFKNNERGILPQFIYAFVLTMIIFLPIGQITQWIVQLLILILPTIFVLEMSKRKHGNKSIL